MEDVHLECLAPPVAPPQKVFDAAARVDCVAEDHRVGRGRGLELLEQRRRLDAEALVAVGARALARRAVYELGLDAGRRAVERGAADDLGEEEERGRGRVSTHAVRGR